MTPSQQLCDHLVGTCQSLQDALKSLELPEDTADQVASELDELCFCCSTCGWWSAAEDEAESEGGEQICIECKEDE